MCSFFVSFFVYSSFSPSTLSFSLLVFENEMSDGDKTFVPAGLPGLRVWEGVRACGWNSLIVTSSLGERSLMVSSWELSEDVVSGLLLLELLLVVLLLLVETKVLLYTSDIDNNFATIGEQKFDIMRPFNAQNFKRARVFRG